MFGEHKTLTNEKIFKVINIKIESNLRIFIISKHKKGLFIQTLVLKLIKVCEQLSNNSIRYTARVEIQSSVQNIHLCVRVGFELFEGLLLKCAAYQTISIKHLITLIFNSLI